MARINQHLNYQRFPVLMNVYLAEDVLLVLYLEIALKYKVKQSKNGKFRSNQRATRIDFETQISLHR